MRPVYGTQGGGLAREVNGRFIFVEVPEWGSFKVGDEVPAEWSVVGPFDWDDDLKPLPEMME